MQTINNQIVCESVESYRTTKVVRTAYVDPIWVEIKIDRGHSLTTQLVWTTTVSDVIGRTSPDGAWVVVGEYVESYGPDGMWSKTWNFLPWIATNIWA